VKTCLAGLGLGILFTLVQGTALAGPQSLLETSNQATIQAGGSNSLSSGDIDLTPALKHNNLDIDMGNARLQVMEPKASQVTIGQVLITLRWWEGDQVVGAIDIPLQSVLNSAPLYPSSLFYSAGALAPGCVFLDAVPDADKITARATAVVNNGDAVPHTFILAERLLVEAQ
jgi:hypothetical protein